MEFLANLQQLPPWLWIISVIGILLITGFIIWAWKRKLHVTKVEVTTGPVKTTLETEKTGQTATTPHVPPSVNISRMRMFGKSKIDVKSGGTNVSDSTLVGEHEINVDAQPQPPSKANRGKPSK